MLAVRLIAAPARKKIISAVIPQGRSFPDSVNIYFCPKAVLAVKAQPSVANGRKPLYSVCEVN